ncbi:MAG: pyridoxine 5'-phosphate synthase [Rhodospirillales bacterium]|jgi:pyridoxine 5-phosphate synthase|nr:pyridoxine 5'-phosphate synthase [Rhodospirillales bacterium]
MSLSYQRLGINIDHVATVRNARGGQHPDPVAAALLAEKAGADGITAHLREDRRHIQDDDARRLMAALKTPLNLEMAAIGEMVDIAIGLKPHACCLVPEKRSERTTEGGLDVAGDLARISSVSARLKAAGIRVSLFIEPDPKQVDAAGKAGAPVIELHTGTYAEAGGGEGPELERLRAAAKLAGELGLECHAGHGLTYANVKPVAAIPNIAELNIGHFLMGEALFVGLEASIKEMRRLMDEARG